MARRTARRGRSQRDGFGGGSGCVVMAGGVSGGMLCFPASFPALQNLGDANCTFVQKEKSVTIQNLVFCCNAPFF